MSEIEKRNKNMLNALIFIDTNVLLDFYRNRKSEAKMQLLDEIIRHKEIIISSFQVEMEFKKNRQSVLGETWGSFKTNKTISPNVPLMFADHKESENLNLAGQKIIESQKILEEEFREIFIHPNTNDEVYKKLEVLFTHESPYILKSDNRKTHDILKRAQNRFEIGCPPRKDKDTSIGDSINWEWILDCAIEFNKPIIIISRDGDYGYNFNNVIILNDYLKHEFNSKTNEEIDIILTNRFSRAFGLVEIPITKEMVLEEEQEIYNRILNKSKGFNVVQQSLDSLSAELLGDTSYLDRIKELIQPKQSDLWENISKSIGDQKN